MTRPQLSGKPGWLGPFLHEKSSPRQKGEPFSSFTAESHQKALFEQLYKQSWCEGGDLNPHGIHHTHLKRARLPVPPPSHIDAAYHCMIYSSKSGRASQAFCEKFLPEYAGVCGISGRKRRVPCAGTPAAARLPAGTKKRSDRAQAKNLRQEGFSS